MTPAEKKELAELMGATASPESGTPLPERKKHAKKRQHELTEEQRKRKWKLVRKKRKEDRKKAEREEELFKTDPSNGTSDEDIKETLKRRRKWAKENS